MFRSLDHSQEAHNVPC